MAAGEAERFPHLRYKHLTSSEAAALSKEIRKFSRVRLKDFLSKVLNNSSSSSEFERSDNEPLSFISKTVTSSNTDGESVEEKEETAVIMAIKNHIDKKLATTRARSDAKNILKNCFIICII